MITPYGKTFSLLFSQAKVQKLHWALTEAKWHGEENLEQNEWYFSTLGIDDSFSDLFPALDDLNLTSGEYYSQGMCGVIHCLIFTIH